MIEPLEYTWRTIKRIEREAGVELDARAALVIARLRRRRLRAGGSNPLRRKLNGSAILIQEGTPKR